MSEKRILIVDDEASIRIMLTRMIEPLNYGVHTAEDGQAAYEMLTGIEFDLIISDLKMPRMTGLTLLEKIRNDGIDSAFIILTGHGDLPQALAARERFNISNFLVKPIHNMDQFLFDVDSAISRRALELEKRGLLESLTRVNSELEEKVTERTRELVKKNEELAHLSNFRADVLRVLGHELRTPLAILAGYQHLSAQGGGNAHPSIATAMGKSILRLQNKVDQALQLLRGTDATQFPLMLEDLDPWGLCQALTERITPLIAHRDITIKARPCPPAGTCRWDREKMEAVFEELLVNAVRASSDHSIIEIGIYEDGDEMEFQVCDFGRGIPSGQCERIFEPFVTLAKPTHHMSGTFEFGAAGIGIGLSTAKMWVELHGGSIAARGNGEEAGTVFTVRLPRIVDRSESQPSLTQS